MKCFMHLAVMSPQWLKLKLYSSGNSSCASWVVLALQQAFSFHGAHCEGQEAQEEEENEDGEKGRGEREKREETCEEVKKGGGGENRGVEGGE